MKLKELTSKKYFYIILFSVLFLLFMLLLILTIKNDVEYSRPSDNMERTYGTVTYVNSYTTTDSNGSDQLHYDVGLHIETDDKMVYDDIFMYDVGPTDIGQSIRLKYDKNTAGIFFIANDPEPRYRIALYVIYSALMLICAAGILMSSRVIRMINQKKVIEKNLEDYSNKQSQTDQHGIDYNSTDSYQGYDGTEKDLNPFVGSDMDYTSMYEYSKQLDDAEYSAEGTYTGYDNQGGNPMDTQYDPAQPYTGYDNQGGNPMDTQYDPTQPYTGYGNQGGNPMDTQYDPTQPYTGYDNQGGNPMDTQYDPTQPYTGYDNQGGNPMDTQYDPTKPYNGY